MIEPKLKPGKLTAQARRADVEEVAAGIISRCVGSGRSLGGAVANFGEFEHSST